MRKAPDFDPHGQGGFTLVELLVALGIFAIIAIAGASLLGFSIDAQRDTTAALDRISALRRGSILLSSDLAQAVPRPSRDARGDPQRAFAAAQPGSGLPLLAFVRGGWTNDGDAARSSLQKVAYRLDGDRIERISWPLVDGVPDDRAITSVIVRGVKTVRLRFRKNGAWRDRWNEGLPTAMPDAVELVATIDGVGELRQLFLIGLGR